MKKHPNESVTPIGKTLQLVSGWTKKLYRTTSGKFWWCYSDGVEARWEEETTHVQCQICLKRVPGITAHLGTDGWIGDDCCWKQSGVNYEN